MTRRHRNARILTQEELREVLSYDPETGLFTARVATHNRPAGAIAGGGSVKTRYHQISVNGQQYRAHRLVWLYVYGHFPEHLIDHINRNKLDNRLANLREVTKAENAQNHGRKPPKSGYVGVKQNRHYKRWEAVIGVGGGRQHLGCFDTPEAAHAAYLAARSQMHTGYVGYKGDGQ